jgi:hypothetical protein
MDAVLSAAATLLGMEVVFLGGLTEDTFTFEKVLAREDWPGIFAGRTADRSDSFCHWMLEGAPSHTADAANEPAYPLSEVAAELEIHSYVGVPVRNHDGVAVATLCGIDRKGVSVPAEAVAVLRQLAEIVATQLGPLAAERVIIQRHPQGGWEVASEGVAEAADDLTSAMVLADLLAEEIAPPGRPPRVEEPLDELARLRLSIKQLEHALAARVLVEQAIGVLAERQAHGPREAFERLRKVARSRGRKVHELAREVVASATDHSVPLPPELAGNR